MPTQIAGDPLVTLASMPPTVFISSSTNASPIVVTTATAHQIQPGDLVMVQGHETNTNANTAAVEAGVVTSNTVELLSTTGNGVGGATGVLVGLGLGATLPIPNDLTDDMDAASVGVPFEALADRTSFSWLKQMVVSCGRPTGPNKTTLTNASPQTLSTRFDVYEIPATLTGNTTLNLMAGIASGNSVKIMRAPSPDSHTANVVCAGGNSYLLAGSTSGWIHLRWDGTNWISIANGTGWTGTNVLV